MVTERSRSDYTLITSLPVKDAGSGSGMTTRLTLTTDIKHGVIAYNAPQSRSVRCFGSAQQPVVRRHVGKIRMVLNLNDFIEA